MIDHWRKNIETRLTTLEMSAGFGGITKFNPQIPQAEEICAAAMGGSLPSRWAEGIGKTLRLKGLGWFKKYMKPGVPEAAHKAAMSWDKYDGGWPVAWGVVAYYLEQQEYEDSKPGTTKPPILPALKAVPNFEEEDQKRFEEMKRRERERKDRT